MKEFNYERCWRTDCEPAFKKLSGGEIFNANAGGIYGLLCRVELLSPYLTQHKKHLSTLVFVEETSHRLRELLPRIEDDFDRVQCELLAEASELVYWAGHLAPGISPSSGKNAIGKRLQESGLYWKFQSLAVASIIRRNGGEALCQAKARHTAAHKKFYDHKEGTEFDNEELAEKYADIGGDIFEVCAVANINYRVEDSHVRGHPFMIGLKHMQGDSGRLDMSQPCAYPGCGACLEDHKSDRVMVLRLKKAIMKAAVNPQLLQMKDKLAEDKIKLDGFAFEKAEGNDFID